MDLLHCDWGQRKCDQVVLMVGAEFSNHSQFIGVSNANIITFHKKIVTELITYNSK